MLKRVDVFRYLRACAICQFFQPPTDWLCFSCWEFFEEEYLSIEDLYRKEGSHPHLRLFDWHGENHVFVQRMIESLKQGGPDFIFRRLALECFSRFVHHSFWFQNQEVFFVPAPPREEGSLDHARAFAEALAFYFGGEVLLILERKNKNPNQKFKSRKERSLLEFYRKNSSKKGTFVFVDDVLTSGSTARAAFRALDRPSQFFIFTLAWRRSVFSEKT